MAEEIVERPVLDLLASMTADSLEASNLDSETLMLVRLAALVAVDASAASYLLNLGAASELGFGAEEIQGVLTAVAPIVGTARVVSASGKMIEGARYRDRDRRVRGRARRRDRLVAVVREGAWEMFPRAYSRRRSTNETTAMHGSTY